MPVKVVESNLNVLQAAKIRIRNVFANGCKIYLSFSSGKDSLCMANLVYEMILSGELDPKQLTVTFIDEEGLLPLDGRCSIPLAAQLPVGRRKILVVLPAVQAGVRH